MREDEWILLVFGSGLLSSRTLPRVCLSLLFSFWIILRLFAFYFITFFHRFDFPSSASISVKFKGSEVSWFSTRELDGLVTSAVFDASSKDLPGPLGRFLTNSRSLCFPFYHLFPSQVCSLLKTSFKALVSVTFEESKVSWISTQQLVS